MHCFYFYSVSYSAPSPFPTHRIADCCSKGAQFNSFLDEDLTMPTDFQADCIPTEDSQSRFNTQDIWPTQEAQPLPSSLSNVLSPPSPSLEKPIRGRKRKCYTGNVDYMPLNEVLELFCCLFCFDRFSPSHTDI